MIPDYNKKISELTDRELLEIILIQQALIMKKTHKLEEKHGQVGDLLRSYIADYRLNYARDLEHYYLQIDEVFSAKDEE